MKHILFTVIALFLAVFAVPAKAESPVPMAVFTIENDDVVEWQVGPNGKYIYFKVAMDKSDELEKLTTENVDKQISFVVNGETVSEPYVQTPIKSRGSLALGASPEMITNITGKLDAAKQVQETAPAKVEMGVGSDSKTE